MSREDALKKLGFASNANPTKGEISRAHSEKIIALKGLPPHEKITAIEALNLAQEELKQGLSLAKPELKEALPSAKRSLKTKISWLLVVGIPLTLTVALAAFLGAYWLMPASWGLSKVVTALAVAGMAATCSALFFTGVALGRALLNKIATHKYDTLLTDGMGITGKMVHALNLGLKAKAWRPYVESFKEWDTYQNPLAFRAGMLYAVHKNKAKIQEIETMPQLSLARKTGPFVGIP